MEISSSVCLSVAYNQRQNNKLEFNEVLQENFLVEHHGGNAVFTKISLVRIVLRLQDLIGFYHYFSYFLSDLGEIKYVR